MELLFYLHRFIWYDFTYLYDFLAWVCFTLPAAPSGGAADAGSAVLIICHTRKSYGKRWERMGNNKILAYEFSYDFTECKFERLDGFLVAFEFR